MALAQSPKNCHLWQNEMEAWNPKCLKPPVFRISACAGMRVIEVFRAYGGVTGVFVQLGSFPGMGALKTDFRRYVLANRISVLWTAATPLFLRVCMSRRNGSSGLPRLWQSPQSGSCVHGPRPAPVRSGLVYRCWQTVQLAGVVGGCFCVFFTSCASLLCAFVIRIAYTT